MDIMNIQQYIKIYVFGTYMIPIIKQETRNTLENM